MNRTDDITNLFSRFGESLDSYLEFDGDFDYKEKPLALVRPVSEPTAVLANSVENVSFAAAPAKLTVATTHLCATIVEPTQPSHQKIDVVADTVLLNSALEHDAEIQPAKTIPVCAPLRHLLAEVVLERQAEAQARNDEALRQSLPHGRPPKSKARVIALVSAKGGVGKSTLSAALASTLRLDGGQTLAIDLDPQNALQYHFGVDPDVAGMGNASLKGENWNSLLLPGSAGSLLLPYGSLTEDERRTLERYLDNDRYWLARQLARMELSENDVVIFDTPPGRTVYMDQALSVADQVVVITTADAACFVTLDRMEKLLGAPQARAQSSICSYVINQFDASRAFSRDMHEVLKRRLGGQLLGVVSLNHAIGEALAYGRNPFVEPGASQACQDMRMLSDRLEVQLKSASVAEIHAS
ncbi:cellulose biosynthesis protein BcsQ [Pseudomonas sp. H11T01]|uniref:cellulose biosynthesis protein BcsQ n=1 Tax=Pseudomonas sp. H11T01 TaxID=3402749 RepID=UPI003ACADFD9